MVKRRGTARYRAYAHRLAPARRFAQHQKHRSWRTRTLISRATCALHHLSAHGYTSTLYDAHRTRVITARGARLRSYLALMFA